MASMFVALTCSSTACVACIRFCSNACSIGRVLNEEDLAIESKCLETLYINWGFYTTQQKQTSMRRMRLPMHRGCYRDPHWRVQRPCLVILIQSTALELSHRHLLPSECCDCDQLNSAKSFTRRSSLIKFLCGAEANHWAIMRGSRRWTEWSDLIASLIID